MMKLRFSPTSPYVRKCTVVAHEAGLHDKIERIGNPAWDPKTDRAGQNPLTKVPTLVLDDGTALYDSPVICEYLDSLHNGRKLIPVSGAARWTALRRQALADGILDSGISRLLETRRGAGEQSKAWIDRQNDVMARGFDAIEDEAGSFGDTVDIGTIAIGCMLGWAMFRFGVDDPLGSRPKFKAWWGRFSQRPSMLATEPQDAK
ncbi:MAG: glutathione S-transferase N-terminal domain-containing protein [Rhodospirillaceae bacterium]|nr:glutathione S-transferase N-terminal domain-containing protein [Rhodospirillaceae bacterium]